MKSQFEFVCVCVGGGEGPFFHPLRSFLFVALSRGGKSATSARQENFICSSPPQAENFWVCKQFFTPRARQHDKQILRDKRATKKKTLPLRLPEFLSPILVHFLIPPGNMFSWVVFTPTNSNFQQSWNCSQNRHFGKKNPHFWPNLPHFCPTSAWPRKILADFGRIFYSSREYV